jgi:hypothetical protein
MIFLRQPKEFRIYFFQCWLDMWKSVDMHMHNGQIGMESYVEVVSFFYKCLYA